MSAEFVAADPYTRLVSRVLFPLHERLKHHSTVAALRELERSQFLPRDELDRLQSQRLRRLLERAATRVPYYRALFAERGIDWREIRAATDLARLPLLSKADIRAAADRLRADDAGALSAASTSGSTGESLTFYLGRERVSHDVAAKWRATRWWGVDIGDPEVVLWASPIESGSQDRLRDLRDRLLRSHFIDARDLSEARVPHLLAQIERADPRMLFGYTSALARLAAFALQRGQQLHCPRLKVVFVTAAKLGEQQRANIRQVFGAPVADGYGGRDAGFIAHECPAGTMHLTEEDLIVEIVDDDGAPLPPGESGEIVVTHLASGDFPFIRYRTGDRGRLGSPTCPCGRTLRGLQAIEGRMNDMLVGEGGRVMHHTGISNVLKDVAGLLNYKVIQEREDLVRVQIVASRPIAVADREHIRGQMRAFLGPALVTEIEQVPDIAPEPSGKHRYIVNRVRQVA